MSFRTAVTCLVTLVIVADCRSIGTSDNVTKRETNDEPFPDWVPFKNKHGEELGEFLQVETVTRKPKKRLALPMNFVMKAVADPDPEEYFDRSLGENDGEDYFEKREWSDAIRSGKADIGLPIRHAELSDIEGVVGIITKQNKPYDRGVQSPQRTTSSKPKLKKEEKPTRRPKPKKPVDYSDEEEDVEQRKPELTSEERIENEKKKALILDSVDDLKERHANEQKIISEKIKEEAMYTEERDRDNIQREIFDKYNQRSKNRNPDYDDYDGKYDEKYRISPLRQSKSHSTTDSTNTRKTRPTSSEFTSKGTTPKTLQTGRMSVFRNPSIYMVYDEETTSSTEPTTKSTEAITLTTPDKSTTTSTSYSTSDKTSTTSTNSDENVTSPVTKEDINGSEHMAFVPQDNELKEGEPTLFFPRKTKRRGNHRARVENNNSSDSLVSATSHDNTTQDILSHLADAVWAGSETSPSGTASGKDDTGPSGHEEIETSGSGSVESVSPTAEGSTSEEISVLSSSPDTNESLTLVRDAVPASSDHKQKEERNGEHEQGGEMEHHAEHKSEHSESGKKAYEIKKTSWTKVSIGLEDKSVAKPKPWYYSVGAVHGFHEDTKTNKGHHDKEDHIGKYDDAGGSKKEHHDESEHYGGHHHEEHGKKHAKYEESGKHSKGHSTKGSHDIHKKEEYEKNVEFFEEDGDSAEEEKHGGHTEETGYKKGGEYREAKHDAGYHNRAKGDSGQFDKGGHHRAHRGHSAAGGHDVHGKHVNGKYMEGGKQGGKKWIYHHGSPAKNANLVVIDRRGDQLYHGPQYYG